MLVGHHNRITIENIDRQTGTMVNHQPIQDGQLLQDGENGRPGPRSGLTVRLAPDVAEALETIWAPVMRELEERLGVAPRLEPDPRIHPDRFELIDGDPSARS